MEKKARTMEKASTAAIAAKRPTHHVMKTLQISPPPAISGRARIAVPGLFSAAMVLGLCLGSATIACRAQPAAPEATGVQVLTRGPVHEAFAETVSFNPQPGIVVTKTPPEVIEEIPPEQRPEGDNITWIPGYWAWDDERVDFVWISGTWRALPPGRAWMAGYWGQTAQGYQWTSGYWADAAAKETTYLPPPPTTVEAGPNIAAPSLDYGWTPGCWIWYSGRYAWRPGYWAQGRADWDWMPAHYVWTPRGYIFVGGFWDYSVGRRGLLFAPVYFDAGVYSRGGYRYEPSIVIDLGVFDDHLFLRPSYGHYYFGDYYSANYLEGGFYASFAFQSGRYGYDPFYSHQRWEHRDDREWAHRVEASYDYRRDHEAARPPRTWAAQVNIAPGNASSPQSRNMIARPMDQLIKQKDSPIRFQPVAKAERQKFEQRGQEVQQSRQQRRNLESPAAVTTTRSSGMAIQPAKLSLPQSPIVAKRANQLRNTQAPPQVPRESKPDLKRQPNSDQPARPSAADRSLPQSQPRPLEPEKSRAPERSETAPRVQPVPPVSERRLQEPPPQLQREAPRSPVAPEMKSPRAAESPILRRPPSPEKGAAQLLRKSSPPRSDESPSPREKPPNSR